VGGVPHRRIARVIYPLKRTLDRLFGCAILRYGETGNRESFIDGERTTGNLGPMRDGELFVYLNKPVSGVFSGLFQDVNAGKGLGLPDPEVGVREDGSVTCEDHARRRKRKGRRKWRPRTTEGRLLIQT
jgi:hypothetical protein